MPWPSLFTFFRYTNSDNGVDFSPSLLSATLQQRRKANKAAAVHLRWKDVFPCRTSLERTAKGRCSLLSSATGLHTYFRAAKLVRFLVQLRWKEANKERSDEPKVAGPLSLCEGRERRSLRSCLIRKTRKTLFLVPVALYNA